MLTDSTKFSEKLPVADDGVIISKNEETFNI